MKAINTPLAVVLALLTIAAMTSAAPVVPNREPTLDELLNLEAAPSVEPVQPDEMPLNSDVVDMLTGQQVTDLFEQAIAQMDTVADRLGVQLDPGLETQRTQESVMAKLDRLIVEAQKQCSGGQCRPGEPKEQDQGNSKNAKPKGGPQTGGANPNTGQPVSGTPVMQPNASTDPLEQHRREWGNLPARVRAELLQGVDEPFSPVYRMLTERYYRRLAEEAGE